LKADYRANKAAPAWIQPISSHRTSLTLILISFSFLRLVL
jgi:hypothetical protein